MLSLDSTFSSYSFASPRVRVRNGSSRPFWWGVAHVLAFLLLLVTASWISWRRIWFWEYPGTIPLVGLTLAAFIISTGFSESIRRVPRTNHFSRSLLAVLSAFSGALALIALGRFYYSRSFLLSAMIGTLTWLLVSHFIAVRFRRPRFGVVPGGVTSELIHISGADWVPLEKVADVESDAIAIDAVVADLHESLADHWVRLLADCSFRGIPVVHAALAYEAMTGRVSLEHLSRVGIDELGVSFFHRVLKRGLDLFLVGVLLPVAIPLAILLAILIRIESPGPVLFWQERRGQGGGSFRMVKFRTMRPTEDRSARFATVGDSRITGVGALARKLRIDELPQFWNILKGEMSFIGPRPEQVPFAQDFEREIPLYSVRHLIRPGLTGWAQVHHGYADGIVSTRAKLEYDLYYVKHIGPLLDLIIILQTVRTVLLRFGAR